MLKTILLAIGLIVLAIIGLSISILLKRNGRFPNIHISQNEALKKKGIKCASHDDDSCYKCSCEIKDYKYDNNH